MSIYSFMRDLKKLIVLLLVIGVSSSMEAKPFKDVSKKNVSSVFAEEKLELGIQVGVGFHFGNGNPADGVERSYQNALSSLADDFPTMETFGAIARYSFDYRWAVQLQGMRQRLYFKEMYSSYFYNAMWDIDVMVEYNILPYGLRAHRPWGVKGLRIRPYSITPYVAIGVGVALSNKHVTVRTGGENYQNWTPESLRQMYTMIDPANGNLAASFYLPMAVGFKWRMAYNWQLKASCQYHLGVGRDPSGGTKNADGTIMTNYADLHNKAVWNNLVLSVGVVYSFGEHKRMLAGY